jgi:hypothetical protein
LLVCHSALRCYLTLRDGPANVPRGRAAQPGRQGRAGVRLSISRAGCASLELSTTAGCSDCLSDAENRTNQRFAAQRGLLLSTPMVHAKPSQYTGVSIAHARRGSDPPTGSGKKRRVTEWQLSTERADGGRIDSRKSETI